MTDASATTNATKAATTRLPRQNSRKSSSLGAAATSHGYQGQNKRSNDHVFESKRAEYEKTMNSIEAEAKILKQKSATVSESLRNLMANDANSAAREEYRNKLATLRAQKNTLRTEKDVIFQKLTQAQESFKAKTGELQSSKEKSLYKKPEDIDRKIAEMEHAVESGGFTISEEKKTIAEISKLRKLRKGLESFDGQESVIGDIKKTIELQRAALSEKAKELKSLDDVIRGESAALDKLSANRSEHQTKIRALMDDRDTLRKATDEVYANKSKAFQVFQEAQKAHSLWMDAERVKWEETNVRRDIERAVRDLEKELQKLELPPHSEKIEQCLNIQTYLRTNVLKESVPIPGTAAGPTPAGRTVEKVDENMILKKDIINDPYSIAPKKSTNKVAKKSADNSSNLKLPFWVISALEELKVNMVLSLDDAKAAIEKLETAKNRFESEQKSKLMNVDSERASIQERIAKEQARFEHVAQEAAQRLKLHASQRKASQKAPVTDNVPINESVAPVAVKTN